MGRRRKKYKRIVKKVRRIPSVYQCPQCGSRSLTIEIKSEAGTRIAYIRCGHCGLKVLAENIPEIYETPDIYGKFIDFYTGSEETNVSFKFIESEELSTEVAEEEDIEGT